jgi:uncharacterized protein
MAPFIGRKTEIDDLELLLRKKSASLVVIQGRRRIGKSRLVEEFGKGKRYHSFTGNPPKPEITAQMQRDEFARQLGEAFDLPGIKSDDWATLFAWLAKQTCEGRVVIMLDEISWMGSEDPTFLGKLKTAWDTCFKKNSKLILILCGSVTPWIEKNILSDTGFLGRTSLILYLKELSLHECSRLLITMGSRASPYEMLKILCVTGGIPRYIEEIQPSLTAEENIRRLCFRKSGILYREFDDIFSDLFSKRSALYKRIVILLKDKCLDLRELTEKLGMAKGGHVSEYIDDLVKSGFIAQDYTWHIRGGKESLLSKYRLSDNYIRFYLKYILSHKNKIEKNHFDAKSLGTLPGWETMMGLQFENLVLNNRSLILQKLGLMPDMIINDGPFFQKKTTKTPGSQVDYLIQTKFNNLFLCEVKFSKNSIGPEIEKEMKAKIRSLITPKEFSKFPILIYTGHLQGSVSDSGFFSNIIDFCEFLPKPKG